MLKKLLDSYEPAKVIKIVFRDMSPKGSPGLVEGAKTNPRPLGIPERTKAARSAVQRSTEHGATRLAKCTACGTRFEAPAEPGSGRCSCGVGGL